MARRKHQKKEIEEVLKLAENAGWRVETPKKGKFKLKCPCPEKHYRTVALTPSSGYYPDHLLDWLQGKECWRGQE